MAPGCCVDRCEHLGVVAPGYCVDRCEHLCVMTPNVDRHDQLFVTCCMMAPVLTDANIWVIYPQGIVNIWV